MDGVLVIDKHKGPTSHDVVQMVKRLTHANRVGHLGTLDPAATGVLPLVLNGATKLAGQLAGPEKVYEFTLRLGVVTDTDDETGRVLERGLVSSEVIWRLEGVLPRFVGSIEQRPPSFSAVKKTGVRSYELARRGCKVLLEPRIVTIYDIKILSNVLPNVWMCLKCRAGTYVRALARDIGVVLGCGAHAGNIRRLKSGRYTIKDAVTVARLMEGPDIWKKHLLPV